MNQEATTIIKDIKERHAAFVKAHHSCQDYGRVLECDGETDLCVCSICGHAFVAACNFDEDYN